MSWDRSQPLYSDLRFCCAAAKEGSFDKYLAAHARTDHAIIVADWCESTAKVVHFLFTDSAASDDDNNNGSGMWWKRVR